MPSADGGKLQELGRRVTQ